MKNNITELVFILDKSGSMAGLESDTIGGFNAMIEKQKRLSGKCFVTTIVFNDSPQIIHDRVSLENIKPMTYRDYSVSGCTALLDSIGFAIKHINTIHKYIRPEDVPGNTMFIITTDGMENASRNYNHSAIKHLIESNKKEKGWEFLFIGANIDAITSAKDIGINCERAVNYIADKKGTGVVYDAVSEAVCCMRAAAPIPAGWKSSIDADYKSRK